MQGLWGITCYFNPIGYERRRRNYLSFRRHLGVPLVTVELGFGDGFDLPPGSADILIQLKGGDVIWQKERLLNIALSRLPQECDRFAWLDCDVVFERDDWAERAAAALERYPLLQPFSRVHEPGPDEWDETSAAPPDAAMGISLAYLLSHGTVGPEILRGNMRVDYRCNSGLAWAARREVIDRDGFYDACVMGSGNRAMLCAALGMPGDAVEYLQMTMGWAAHYLPWADRHFREVQGKIGCIEGAVVHLWHGDLKRRRYQERHREFSAFGYSPLADIALDENACWRWSSAKNAMHAYVADYFRARREDGE